MKKKILTILDEHIEDNMFEDAFHPDNIRGNVAVELAQLMCYREVKAIIDWLGIKYLEPDYEDVIVMQLKEQYSTEMIWQAINQVKNEQK